MASDGLSVGVVGSGPAVESFEVAVEDVDIRYNRIDLESSNQVDLCCLVATTGSREFERANEARTGPWIAVELGGMGAYPLPSVDASVSVFGDGPGCYQCLRYRVGATVDGEGQGDRHSTPNDARFAGAIAGRLAVQQITGTDLAGQVIEVPYVERELLAVPTCDCGDPPARELQWTDGSMELDATVNSAERTIDDRIGLISSIGEAESFPAPYYLTTLADTSGFSDVQAGPNAAGVAVDWNQAFMKAAGEALERYAAGVYRASTFRSATASEIDNAVRPDEFVRPEGYPTPADDEPLRWKRGEALGSGESVCLPAEYVVFPPPKERFKPAITTGLGLGTSTVGAVLSGLYEVIERDATMLAWYSTFEPLGLDVDDDGFDTLARRARGEGLQVTPLLVTQDIDIPVVSVAVHRRDDWPRFAVGSGANLDPATAARSALTEALQNWMELRGMGPDAAAEEETSIGRYSEFPPEVRGFVEPAETVTGDELAPGEVDSGQTELEAVQTRIEAADLRAYVARLTTADLERIGFEAVRVVSPTAQPLFIEERCFGERAKRVPRELGYRPRFDRPPHPYP